MLKYDIRTGVKKIKTKTALTVSGATIGAAGLMMAVALPAVSKAAPVCTPVNTSKGALTAAQVGGNITGEVDATGCDIGVYINGSNLGTVNDASVHDANQYGVFVDGNSGDVAANVTGSKVYNIGHHDSASNFAPNGSQFGVGIYYSGLGTDAVSGTISGNNIHDYQKGGVAVNGSNASASVRDNDIAGLSEVPFIAQNGIQLGYGASGQVQRNTVNGNWYTGADWASTGILVFESDNVNVDGNTVEGNQTGVDAESWCYLGPSSANNNKFVNNTISGSDYGVIVAAYSLFSSCDAQANNNKVTNNTISGTGSVGSEGVFVGSAVVTGSFSPEASNNKVIHNSVSGFETPSDTSTDATAKVHANSFQ